MRQKILYILPAAALIIFLTVLGSSAEKSSPATNGADYLASLRLIGHRLLLSAGDEKSRVLPVRKLSETSFQIQFENQLTLEPNSIVRIIRETVNLASLSGAYSVNVLNCQIHEVVYSYFMTGSDSTSIVPCLGRTLPLGCYFINIDFSAPKEPMSKRSYILAGGLVLVLLASFLMFFYIRRKRPVEAVQISDVNEAIAIGRFLFHFDQRFLEIGGEKIVLTDKESKLLYILAGTPNQTVDRELLQREVWENEGVIVTRSLDVFISKIRKKLEKDPNVRISNVHGKGYKLELPQKDV